MEQAFRQYEDNGIFCLHEVYVAIATSTIVYNDSSDNS
jgi:hypothetical protein